MVLVDNFSSGIISLSGDQEISFVLNSPSLLLFFFVGFWRALLLRVLMKYTF